MSYLVYIALFGAAVVFFLWLRDARIFYRTGFSGYRKAAYRGIFFGALALLGVAVTIYSLELPGARPDPGRPLPPGKRGTGEDLDI